MAHVPKDIKSVVKQVETCHSRIVSLQDSSLTSIQRQQSEARLQQELADDGVTYSFGHYDSGGRLTFVFASLRTRDSGVITDVSPVGSHPIDLSVGENVRVSFEPRDLTEVPSWRYANLSNKKFASLSKGNSFDFTGRVEFCDYWPNRPGGSFHFRVASDFRPPMSVAGWLRKLWDGTLPGIDFVR